MTYPIDNALVESLLNCIEKPAIFIDTDYVIHAVNRHYREKFSKTIIPGESHCYQISHGWNSPCDEHKETCPLKGCRESNKTNVVVHVHKSAGSNVYCEITMHPIKGESGVTAGYLEILERVIEESDFNQNTSD